MFSKEDYSTKYRLEPRNMQLINCVRNMDNGNN